MESHYYPVFWVKLRGIFISQPIPQKYCETFEKNTPHRKIISCSSIK